MIQFKKMGCVRTAAILSATVALAACGSRGPVQPEAPEAPPTAANAIIMPAVAYGTTSKGLVLSKADDSCGAPELLRSAVQDQLEEPLEFVIPAPVPSAAGAATLKVEITDILANAGGMYGGPKILEISGQLQRPGQPVAKFTGRRQMFIYVGLPRSTCSMLGNVAYKLGTDIVTWMKKPVDGAFLGER